MDLFHINVTYMWCMLYVVALSVIEFFGNFKPYVFHALDRLYSI